MPAPARWRIAALALAIVALTPLAAQADGHQEAGRRVAEGRRVFEVKQCARCHVEGGRGAVPALEALGRPQGAWQLAGRLWNHVPAMFTALGAEGVPWPAFTTEEMTALMTYLRANPEADATPDASRGLSTLVQKGCLKCHALRGEGARIGPPLESRMAAFASPAEWSARIWRHGPSMATTGMAHGIAYPRFGGQDMAHLVGYLKTVGAAPAR